MKKTLIAAAAILASALLFISCGAKAPTEWTTDYNAALESAKKSGSNILLYVSGPDEEGVCEKLTTTIMTNKNFMKAAKGFIAVQLDVDTSETADMEEQNAILDIGMRLGLQYYPSILCLTPDERIFADIFYDPDSATLESMIQDMKDAVESGKRVAELNKKISNSDGVKKAEYIHALLESIPENYFNSYLDLAQQVPDLDPENKTGIVGTYKIMFAYNDAVAYLFDGDIDSAVQVYDTLAADSSLKPEDSQQCYFFAASLWYYMQDWENCFAYLQKSIDVAPESGMADTIREQLAMLQMSYELSLSGDVE